MFMPRKPPSSSVNAIERHVELVLPQVTAILAIDKPGLLRHIEHVLVELVEALKASR
jgi:hypothetical protein